MEDPGIIALYFQRDERAIAETEEKYGRLCHSIAYHVLQNREDTEECVNDTWIAGEHCLVLVGYDEHFYYLNDPASGSTVGYQRAVVEQRFVELGSRALLISPRTS